MTPQKIQVEKFNCYIESCEKHRVWIDGVGFIFYSEEAAMRYLWERVKP